MTVARSSPQSLHPYRHGLFFSFFHALNWQVAIGTPTVLFMQELRATPFEAGLVFAWTFLLMPVQVIATVWLPRLGYKRLALFGWNMRAWFLAVPVVIAFLAPLIGRQGWMVGSMVGAMFGYCVFRAAGAAALTPWLYQVIPEEIRGRYWSTEQMLAASAGLGVLALCSLLFAVLPVFVAYSVQYSIAAIGALFACAMLQRLPDVERPKLINFEEIVKETPRLMFSPGTYRTYLWLSISLFMAITPLPAFAAYFLKSTERATSAQIMILAVLTYLGVIAANLVMRTFIDRVGAKPFFRLSYASYASAAVGWLLLMQFDRGWKVALPILFFIQGAAGACWTSSNLNYLAKIVPPENRALPVSVHGASITFLGGFAPVLWGLFLRAPGQTAAVSMPVLAGYFGVLLFVAVLLMFLVRGLPELSGAAEPLIRGGWVLRPIRGLATLISFVEPHRKRSGSPDKEP